MTTCQICARAIRAAKGKIAHHGYKRPSRYPGWQTASCPGARGLPYEVSSNLLPPTIERIEKFKAEEAARLADLIANPPEKLHWRDLDAYGRVQREGDADRPAEFIVGRHDRYSGMPHAYATLFRERKYNLEQAVHHAELDLAFLRDRLAKWVPPATSPAA